MTNEEIIQQASAIRRESAGASQYIFSAAEADMIDQADRITRERQSLGISGLIESAVAAIRGERASAEKALARAREREGRIEQTIARQALIQKALGRERGCLEKLRQMEGTKSDERSSMLSRFWARHEPRFAEHLSQMAAKILADRIVAEALPLYVAEQEREVAKLENELASVAKELSKLK